MSASNRNMNFFIMTNIIRVLLLLFLMPAIGAVLADALDDCNSSEPKRVVAGCTAMIDQGDLKGPVLAIAYSRRSDAHLEQDALDKAIADRKKSIELDPSNDNLKFRLADAYALRGAGFIEKKEFDSAIADLNAAHQLQSDNASFKETLAKLHELQGVAQLQDGQYIKAISAFTEAIKLGHSTSSLHMSRALAHTEANDADSAIKDYADAIRLDSELLEAYRRRGELFLKQGAARKAISDFNEVLNRKPKNIDVLLLRALAFEPQTSSLSAMDDYKAVLKIDPKNRDAKKGIKRVQKARSALVKLVQIELKRVGCDPGAIDGRWGRKGKSALAAFARHADGLTLANKEPGEVVLAIIRVTEGRVCPTRKYKRNLACCIEVNKYACRKGYEQLACGRERADCIRYIEESNQYGYCSFIESVRKGTWVPSLVNQ